MIRDSMKNDLYFKNYIEFYSDRIKKSKHQIQLGLINPKNLSQIQYFVNENEINLFIAKYSKGEKIEKLLNYYTLLVEEMNIGWDHYAYQNMLWMMSIGIMFDINNEIFNILAQLVEKNNVKDYVLQYLIESKLGKPQTYNEYPILFERRLVKNLIEPDYNTASKNIKKYLNSWYACNHSCPWYDKHKSDDYLYFGYWSFECGAIAKIRGLEDSNMKNAQYYPYDLVHYTDSLK